MRSPIRFSFAISIGFLLMMLMISVQGVFSEEGRFALVIGNSSYTDLVKLKNPVNDATDIASALKELGFQVELILDGDLSRMENAVVRLGNRLAESADSIGFFFYAGHGVQFNGVNYLIPTDANIVGEAFLKTKALAAQSVLDTLQAARNNLNLVVLDACRDTPFSWVRSGTRGLAVVGSQPPGSIVVYSTSAGSTAQDGSGRNGVFTAELLKNIKKPIDVIAVFQSTGAGVQDSTSGMQVPAIYSQYFGKTYLAGAPQAAIETNLSRGSIRVGWLPPGSKVSLDGVTRLVPEDTGSPFVVDNLLPKQYALVVALPDAGTFRSSITVDPDKTTMVEEPVSFLLNGYKDAKVKAMLDFQRARVWRIGGGITLAAGLAGVISGIVFYSIGSNAYSSYKSATNTADADSYRATAVQYQNLFWIALAGGGISVVGGTLMLSASPDPTPFEMKIKELDQKIASLSSKTAK